MNEIRTINKNKRVNVLLNKIIDNGWTVFDDC